jgi:hypothetical protein
MRSIGLLAKPSTGAAVGGLDTSMRVGQERARVRKRPFRTPSHMSYFAPIYEFLHSRSGIALLGALLLIGLWNMFRGAPANNSQKLMRWRVGLQFAAILLILGVVLLRR